MTDSRDIIYIVHGSHAHTWWRRLANGGYPWWRRWSLFSCAMRRTLGRDCVIREFRWSGHNTHKARLDAGADLARVIQKESSNGRVHLIGHSHGGNVALAAVNQLAPQRVDSVIVLANPNMALLDSLGSPPEWLYWGKASKLVRTIWNLHSPQDFVQGRLAQWFHGVPTESRRNLLVRHTYAGTERAPIQNAAIHWRRSLAAHRSMHSEVMGAVVGSLLAGTSFPEAMKAAGLSVSGSNDVRDSGGWPGAERVFDTIREVADPSPFEFGDSSTGTGVLFIHGFTASPAEMRPMAQFVSQSTGWRCIGPLLPGHGTRIEDMQRAGAADWLTAVERAYEGLSRECDRVFLAGLSLGAVLACHLALGRSHDPKLRGMVLMAPAFGVTRSRAVGIRLLRPVRSLGGKGTRAADYFLDHRLYSYLQIPLNRTVEILQLGRDAVRNLPKLRNLPTIMFVGDRESTVSLAKMLRVAEDNPWIRLVRLQRSRHILTVEPDREMMFEASVRFMEECVGKEKSH